MQEMVELMNVHDKRPWLATQVQTQQNKNKVHIPNEQNTGSPKTRCSIYSRVGTTGIPPNKRQRS
jgi:hypothetical protein